ncbi:MAG: hypothetical protein OXI56_11620 [bacterium]|nr:hypothetical protein [bacterium]MDE0602431.1 hypothetical protein [bacterium]
MSEFSTSLAVPPWPDTEGLSGHMDPAILDLNRLLGASPTLLYGAKGVLASVHVAVSVSVNYVVYQTTRGDDFDLMKALADPQPQAFSFDWLREIEESRVKEDHDYLPPWIE